MMAWGPMAEGAKVPVAGVSPNNTANPLRTIESVVFSPNGQQLLIRGALTASSTNDFAYTLPLSGGIPTKVNEGTADVDFVPRYTPDGTQIVYSANNQLLRVPAAGGAATTITTDDTRFFHITSDGQRVVYISRPTGSTPDVLRSVLLTGGATTVLSTPTQGDIDRETFQLTPDGQTVVFASSFLNPTSANEDSLFRVPAAGGAAPTLINFGPTAPHIIDIRGVEVTGDGRVAFVADYLVNNNYNLNFVPIGGGTAALLPGFSIPSGADIRDFRLSPDGRYFAFSSDFQTVNVFELYVAEITGGAPVKVSLPFTAEAIDLDITGDGFPDISDGNIDSDILEAEGAIAWSPDGRKVAYIADGEIDNLYELYLVDNPLFEAAPGDYNADGLVDLADYTVWRDTLNSTTDLRADGSNNNVVDQADYAFWVNAFNGVNAVAVPEPGTAGFVLLGLLATYWSAPLTRDAVRSLPN
ncbi:translocation protein TolB [Botrimarina hoheduenensis]|uniref:Translocation protein TolB n=2 Tax=Botrimarina hoheduenensis TaxID=2528000 RepID=A0A5C5WCH3_9BACT|nr:translocation protein TolB [Botrimarina hoheduenensis]